MRLAILQDHLRNGGTERQTLAIAEGLAALGVDVHLIVFRAGGILDAEAERLPVTLHHLKQGMLKSDWFAPGLFGFLKTLSPDVVLPMGRMANCYAGLLTFTFREFKLLATFRTGKKVPFLYRKALRDADQIVANSNEALRRIERDYGIRRIDTASVIYNGCIRDFDSVSRTVNEHSTVRFCSVSMFRPEKQQIRLVRICAKLPKSILWHLTLAGEGSTLESCKAEAEKLGVADRVAFPGLLNDPRQVYLNSDIALHTSDLESLPNFLVEAQMSGLPVIAYDVNGVGETFLDKESGYLIVHQDEPGFLEALKKLAQESDLRIRMSSAAIRFAESHFSKNAQALAYHALLSKIVTK